MGHGRLLAARILLQLLLHSCHSSSEPQGAKFPYMTSNFNEVAGESFDYIVVGGGAAGCPLAATLSEKLSILLIEHGGSPYGNPWIMNKRFYGFPLLQTDEFSSVSQSFTSKEGVVNHRGRVLGGTTALNAGFYSRASNDFARTAGWDEELVKESYEWVESKIVTKPDQLTTRQAAVKSQFLEAAGILPYNGFTWEHIKGTKLSRSIFDSRGTRHTSADLLQMGRPENIKVLFNPTVKSVIFRNSGVKFPYMTSKVDEVAGRSFDYIVVGGGAAGCLLTATLSEKFSVLLIERGGSPYGNPWITEKCFFGFPLLQADEFSSVSHSKEGIANHRGRVLGGSTAINGGFYGRASDRFVMKSGWDKQLVKESYEWVESKIVTRKPELTKWKAAVKSGLLESRFRPYNGFTLQHVEGTKISGYTFDNRGMRHTSADLLQAGRPENIVVLLNATVKSVIFDKGESNKTTARGIQFINSNGDTNRT